MPFVEGFVQVAVDGAGKRIRNVANAIVQPDGTVLTTYQQVVTRATEAGVFLDTQDWVETDREGYMRGLTESALGVLGDIAAALGVPSPLASGVQYTTITPGE